MLVLRGLQVSFLVGLYEVRYEGGRSGAVLGWCLGGNVQERLGKHFDGVPTCCRLKRAGNARLQQKDVGNKTENRVN